MVEPSDSRIVVGEGIVYFWDGKVTTPVKMDDVDMFAMDRNLVSVARGKGPRYLDVMAIICADGGLNILDLVTCDMDAVAEFSDALSEAPGHNFIAYRKDPAIWGATTPRFVVNADRITRKWAEEQMYRMTRTYRVMVPDRDW